MSTGRRRSRKPSIGCAELAWWEKSRSKRREVDVRNDEPVLTL
jgi:hypothetical protein